MNPMSIETIDIEAARMRTKQDLGESTYMMMDMQAGIRSRLGIGRNIVRFVLRIPACISIII